jgi:hypothetical protein
MSRFTVIYAGICLAPERPMNTLLARTLAVLALAGALAACAPKDNSIEPASTGSPPPSSAVATQAGASGSTSALPGVIATQPDLPGGNTGAGPGAGQTAIGGLNAKQEAGGQTGGAPAPTGGDAAPAKNSSK